jgi:hypothetical protein
MYFVTLLVKRHYCLTTPHSEEYGLGCSRFARRYSGNLATYVAFFSFPPGIEVCSIGFPHSEISGSKVRDTSPKRIAASRVFHRHVEPRHPPYALNFLLGNLEIISVLLTQYRSIQQIILLIWFPFSRYRPLHIF